MTKHVRVLAGVLSAILVCHSDLWAISRKERNKLLENTRIVVEGSFDSESYLGLDVFSGNGKKLLQVGGVGRSEDPNLILDKSYFQPDMHPDQKRFVAIRCAQFPRTWTSRRELSPTCDVILFEIDNATEETLYTHTTGAWVSLPVWSPSGDRLAFFENRDILIWSREGIVRIPGVLDSSEEPFHWFDRALGWDTNGEALFVYGDVPGRVTRLGIRGVEDVGQIDLQNRQVTWLNLHQFNFMHGKYDGKGMILVADTGLMAMNKEMPDLPATRALFGSAANPVLKPQWGPGRAFFFYVTERQGLFASIWLEGYELESRQVFHVRTLDRTLYRE